MGQVWLQAGRLFHQQSSLRHYLFVIARTVVRDCWGRLERSGLRSPSEDERRFEELADRSSALDSVLVEKYENHEIIAALSRVPDPYRVVVELLLRGYSNFEIAEALDLNYHTVRSRLARGKAALLSELGIPAVEPSGSVSRGVTPGADELDA